MKIKKLETELWLAKQTFFFRIEMGPTIFENWVMEIENWVTRIDEPNGPLVSLVLSISLSAPFS